MSYVWVASCGEEEPALVLARQQDDGAAQHVGQGSQVDLLQIPSEQGGGDAR